jgi:hypothetical protein
MNEHLDSLEDSIRDLNKLMREVNQKQKEQSIIKFPKKSTTKKQIPTITPKSQCTWRTSPPMNTTFEVSYPIK